MIRYIYIYIYMKLDSILRVGVITRFIAEENEIN